MRIYLYADQGPEVDRDRVRLIGAMNTHLRILRIGLGHNSVADIVGRLTVPGVTTLILPDQFTRHSPDMERVRQCALQLDLKVMPLTHFLLKQKPATPSALAGQPRLPVAEGQAVTA